MADLFWTPVGKYTVLDSLKEVNKASKGFFFVILNKVTDIYITANDKL